MTAIVAVKTPSGVIMAGDSAAVNMAGAISPVSNPKVFFRDGGYMIGYSGSFRTGQLLEHVMELPILNSGEDVTRMMVTRFIPGLKKMITDQGGEPPYFLLSINGRIFSIESDYQCREDNVDFAAVGAGREYALGALEVLVDVDPIERAFMALRAASKFSAFVIPPFHAVDDKGKKHTTKR